LYREKFIIDDLIDFFVEKAGYLFPKRCDNGPTNH